MKLQRAGPEDAAVVAVLHRLTVRLSLPFLPELHTPEADLRFFSERLLPDNETWLAQIADAPAGYVAFKPGWISHLYVHPEHQGRGVGGALLAKALKDRAPRRLWTFQKNLRARRFYEARGFVLVRLTDGRDNEEREPDALYEWRP
ncbi:MAG: GNAT family N-acetyltransferase [Phenylobacterium sp.]|uniref:GNAT family N-acetyltransferase n=1 Tax=Phenylobacterium sp. TaxID=1871053 RepID=UPI00391B8E49